MVMSKHMTIDSSDPAVRAALSLDQPRLQNRRNFVQLAGDVPDPTGVTSHRGIQSTHVLTTAKQEIVVVFGDQLMTVDLYALPGEPVRVQLICPRCLKHSTITSERKRIEFDPKTLNPARGAIMELARRASAGLPEVVGVADYGRLSIETFECTWEIGGDKHVPGRVHTGASLCRLRLIIDDNRAREV